MQIELKETIEDKVASTLRQEKLSREKSAQEVVYHKQRETKILLDGLKIELTSHFASKALVLANEQREMTTTPDETMIDFGTQTEVKAVGRNLEVVSTHKRQFKRESDQKMKIDGECQTELNDKVIEFMSQGSQRYERVIKYGLIKERELNKVNVDIMEHEEYYTKLIE